VKALLMKQSEVDVEEEKLPINHSSVPSSSSKSAEEMVYVDDPAEAEFF
jgi:hypothetical protein